MYKTQSNSKQSKLGMSLQATTPTTNYPPSLETNSKNLSLKKSSRLTRPLYVNHSSQKHIPPLRSPSHIYSLPPLPLFPPLFSFDCPLYFLLLLASFCFITKNINQSNPKILPTLSPSTANKSFLP